MIWANILIKLSTWANDSINNKTTNENKDEMTGHTFISFLIVSLAYLLSINVTSI